MDRKTYKVNRVNKNFLKFNNSYYNKQVNRIIFVLITVLVILIVKAINHRSTNNIINIIEKNIYYDFSIKEDGKKVKDYLVKIIGGSKETIEELLAEQFNKNNK